MKLRYASAAAAIIFAHCAVAVTFETVVRDTCAGDVRIVCTGCKRDLTLPREALEKSIKQVISKEL